MVVKDAITLILMLFMQKVNNKILRKIVVESCDEAIGKENDVLKLEVKRLKQKVRVLMKQVKAQPS
jgi:hypothetical protein